MSSISVFSPNGKLASTPQRSKNESSAQQTAQPSSIANSSAVPNDATVTIGQRIVTQSDVNDETVHKGGRRQSSRPSRSRLRESSDKERSTVNEDAVDIAPSRRRVNDSSTATDTLVDENHLAPPPVSEQESEARTPISVPEKKRKTTKKRRSSIRFSTAPDDVAEIPHRAAPENKTYSGSDKEKTDEDAHEAESDPVLQEEELNDETAHTSRRSSTNKTLDRRGEKKRFAPSETLLQRGRERKEREKGKAEIGEERAQQEARHRAIIPTPGTPGARRSKRVRFKPGEKRFEMPMLMEKHIKAGKINFMTAANLGEYVSLPNRPAKTGLLTKGSARQRKTGNLHKRADDTLDLFGDIDDHDDIRLAPGTVFFAAERNMRLHSFMLCQLVLSNSGIIGTTYPSAFWSHDI